MALGEEAWKGITGQRIGRASMTGVQATRKLPSKNIVRGRVCSDRSIQPSSSPLSQTPISNLESHSVADNHIYLLRLVPSRNQFLTEKPRFEV